MFIIVALVVFVVPVVFAVVLVVFSVFVKTILKLSAVSDLSAKSMTAGCDQYCMKTINNIKCY